ncbi:MAG: hypothetical protein NTV99_10435 [Deltaproteobacteria bacterium]|nr:hypothetical protein [Deltaproteobacteria bacterium]
MRHPPYHLRPNKAVDRFLLVSLLNVLRKYEGVDLRDYTYYGFGGPFLEDCRLLHEYNPEIKLVSLEHDNDTYKRQEFHRFSRHIEILNNSLMNFLTDFESKGRDIFWLDFTDFKLERFNEYMTVLNKVGDLSIVKITLRAQLDENPFKREPASRELEKDIENDKQNYLEEFRAKYGKLLRRPLDESCFSRQSIYLQLIQDMLRVKTEQALPAAAQANVFQVLNSSFYADQTYMLSVTGIVCTINQIEIIKKHFRSWQYANLDWKEPRRIDVPILSVKERLHLEKLLPSETKGKDLAKALGYEIDRDHKESQRKMRYYNDFYRFYPSFVKVIF